METFVFLVATALFLQTAYASSIGKNQIFYCVSEGRKEV